MIKSESGTHWLAGQEVKIIETDEGENWENAIVKVEGVNRRGKRETAWIYDDDIVIGAV